MEPSYAISPLLVYAHIVTGTVGLLSGTGAMILRKGSRWHINVGKVYLISMLVTSAIGTYGSLFAPERISTIVGPLTIYLVITAWLAFRCTENKARWTLNASVIMAILIAAAGYYFGFDILNKTEANVGFPYWLYFFFGSVALMAGLMDVRVILHGGIFGKQRLIRHLWRMCFSLFLATASLFLGQPQVFPESIRKPQLLMIPVVIVLVSLLFWLLKMVISKRFAKT